MLTAPPACRRRSMRPCSRRLAEPEGKVAESRLGAKCGLRSFGLRAKEVGGARGCQATWNGLFQAVIYDEASVLAIAVGDGTDSRHFGSGLTPVDIGRSPDLFVWIDTCNVYLLREGDAAVLIDLGEGRVLDHFGEVGQVRAGVDSHGGRSELRLPGDSGHAGGGGGPAPPNGADRVITGMVGFACFQAGAGGDGDQGRERSIFPSMVHGKAFSG